MVNPVLSIDVSKSISHAALFLSQGQVYLKPFAFTHSPSGVGSLLVHLEKVELETGVRPKVALESTGNYSKPLVKFFEDNDYEVVVFNPLETHQLKKNSIRKVKTDIVDTHRIAQVFYSNTFTFHTKTDSHILELRALCRQYEGFNNLYTETQLRFRNVLDLLFPNYDKIFNTVCCKTSLHLLYNFPSPECVLSADRRELAEVLKTAKHSSAWVERKVFELLLAARESLPDSSAQQSNTRVLKDYIEILLTQQKILTDLRAQMASWARLSPHFELLLSIPGVGELTATTILAEIGDINDSRVLNI